MANDMLGAVLGAAGAHEGYEIRKFVVYRPAKVGGPRELVVEVWDSGETGSDRYSVTVKDLHNPEAKSVGNSAPSVDEALRAPHWREFD
jgi:hypothetical protein